jgi:hypothetical protein
MPDGIPAMVGGYLPEGVRDQGHLGRAHVQHEVDEFLFLGIPFDIEFGCDDLFDGIDVCVADMAFVRPGVDGDAVGAKGLGVCRRLHYIRVITSAAIAQGRKFVDIYGKLSHRTKVRKKEKGTEVPPWVRRLLMY